MLWLLLMMITMQMVVVDVLLRIRVGTMKKMKLFLQTEEIVLQATFLKWKLLLRIFLLNLVLAVQTRLTAVVGYLQNGKRQEQNDLGDITEYCMRNQESKSKN